MRTKTGGVPTTPRFHEDDHVVPAGLKGIINSTKDGVSEVEFRVRGSDGFADVIIMRVPDVKLEHDPD